MDTAINTATLQFLQRLEKNNNRDWFMAHKDEFDAAQENMTQVVHGLILALSKFDTSIQFVNPRKCLFRIYRDVRFSKNKAPYKTNFGAWIVHDSSKQNRAGYYLHIKSGESFAAGGLYQPDAGRLRGVREHIANSGNRFVKLLQDKQFKKIFCELSGDKLRTAPKGFDKEHSMLEYLKHKDYIAFAKLSDEDIQSDLVKKLSPVYKAMKPLNDFLNEPL